MYILKRKLFFVYLLLFITFIKGKEKIDIGALITNLVEDTSCFKSAMMADADGHILPNHQLVIHFMDVHVSFNCCKLLFCKQFIRFSSVKNFRSNSSRLCNKSLKTYKYMTTYQLTSHLGNMF